MATGLSMQPPGYPGVAVPKQVEALADVMVGGLAFAGGMSDHDTADASSNEQRMRPCSASSSKHEGQTPLFQRFSGTSRLISSGTV
jgi:hypothetical protein